MALIIKLVFVLVGLVVSLTTGASINVSLGFIAPLDPTLGPLATLGKELESAFKLAIKQVNENSNLIRFRPHFRRFVKDESVKPAEACKKIAAQFDGDSQIVGIVGGYYSECSIAVQQYLHGKDTILPQISYRSMSMELSDRKKYPNFYRVTSNNKLQAQAVVDIIKNFHWNKAGIIHSDDTYYGLELRNEITSRARISSITIEEKVSFPQNATPLQIDDKLQIIKSSGSRINIIVAQGEDVFTIFRRIKHKQMDGVGWVWIGTDGVSSLYFQSDPVVNVTARGLIAVNPRLYEGGNLVDLIIKWYEEDKFEYPGQVWSDIGEPSISPHVGQVFRAVSAYQHVLENLVRNNQFNQDTTTSTTRKLVKEGLDKLANATTGAKSIIGGPIFFDKQNEEPADFTITNYVDNGFNIIGKWKEGVLDLTRGTIVWPGGGSQTPTDLGEPGKALFRIGFVAPIHPQLGILSEHGKELVSAFKVALDIVNSDSTFKVELGELVTDEGVDGTSSCVKLASDIIEKNLVAVVGAYRSECSIKLHEGLAKEKIPIVSYASTSKVLSDKTRFKYFFRIVSDTKDESYVLQQLAKKYAFKEVAELYSDDLASSEVAETFASLMPNKSITTRQKFPHHQDSNKIRSYVQQIRQSGTRVILMATLPKDALVVKRIVQELNMAGKGWIWLGSAGATVNYFHARSSVGKTMDGMLGVNPRAGSGNIYNNMLSTWFRKDSLKYPGIVHSIKPKESLPYTAQVFDAVHGIAIALSDLVSRKMISHKSDVVFIRSMLVEKLGNFDGPDNGYPSATGGKMYFDKNQDGPPVYDVVNLQHNQWKRVGVYDGTKDRDVRLVTNPIFPGGSMEPVVAPGKVIYKVAAFFPTDEKLSQLSELGGLWESALRAAVNWLNANETFNVGFDSTSYDTGVSTADCYRNAEKLPSNVDIVIGAARSTCTDIIYKVLEDRNIPMITYSATSSVLSKKTVYPNLFRVCPSDTHQAMALAELIEKYTWEKVGIITAKGIYGQELAGDIQNYLKKRAIEVTTVVMFEPNKDSKTDKMVELKRAGAGVNLIIADPNDAIQLYQEAFELGMLGKGWTWLGSDGATSTTFKRWQNLQHAMQGMVGFRPRAGKGNLFGQMFQEWLHAEPAARERLAYIAQVFDSVVVPAQALHQLHTDRTIVPSTPKSVARKKLLDKLRSMRDADTGFDSTTNKRLYFDFHQDVLPSYDLVNLNGADWVTVGTYENGRLDINSKVIWSGGTRKIPASEQPDRKPIGGGVTEGTTGTSDALIVLAVVFSLFGVLVIIFMVYIVRRVRYRHLYMQSDLNQGGVFSVLYGHTVNKTNNTDAMSPETAGVSPLTPVSNGVSTIKTNSSEETTIEMTEPMLGSYPV